MPAPHEQIVVTVAPDGAVLATTRGIKGTACLDYLALLEDLLDAETATSAFTEEYQETSTRSHHEVNRDQRQQ